MSTEEHWIEEPCADNVGLLVRAADGVLDAAGQAELDAHLAGCAACRAALDRQRAAREALADWPRAEASAAFAGRVMNALGPDEIEAPEVPGWFPLFDFRRWTWRLAPLAAGLALAAGVMVNQSAAVLAEATVPTEVEDVPVSSALWSESVSEDELLSLLLTAEADAPLADALEEAEP